MTDVDQRVVQMRFDDKDFEEKARKTMSTLDKLNEKLSFDEAAKKSDAALNDIVDNVETIANKAYSIVDRIIDKIKDNVATKVVDFINDATLKPLTSGWQKYTDMTKSVGTMISQGHKMDDVTRSLEKLSFFADETSYSFNDMISNIARFTATGVNLEDATAALMGISNWAAMSGQNAQTASRAFFQLSQAMGSYMQKKDWVSVMTANMDTQEFRQTALDTAVALGTLKKTANDTYVSLRATTSKGAQPFTSAEFIESLTPGKWFTSEVMVETYKKYSEAVDKIYDIYSERRDKGENVTASQVLAEVKEENRKILLQYQQLNKVDEQTAETELDKWRKIKKATADDITNYAKLHKISKELAANELNKDYVNAVSEYAKQYGKTIEQSTQELERWQEYTSSFGLKAFMNAQEARTFTDVVESVKETVSTAWLGIYEQIFGNYNEAKQIWTDMSNNLIELFAGRLWDIQDMFKQWREEGGREKLWQGLYAFGAGIKTFIESIRAAWDLLISDGDGVGKLMNITEKIREAGFKFYIFIRELTQSEFFANITAALYNIKTFVEDIFGAAYDGIRDAVPGGKIIMGLLIEFSSIFKEITENFKLSDEAIDGLRRTFKGLTIILLKSKKTLVEVLVKIVLPILNAVFTVLGELFEVVVQITGTLGDILEYFMPLNKEGSSLVTILGFLTDLLTTIVKIVGTGITYVLKALVPLLGGIIGLVVELADGIANLFKGKQIKMSTDSNQVFGAFAKLKKLIEESWAPLKGFTEIIDEYKDGKGLINFLNMFADISEGIGNRLLLTIDSIVGFLQIMSESKFGKALGYALKAIRYLVKGAMWLFNNLFIPILKEVILELGMTIESVKGIIDKRGIMGLLDLIQEVFKTGIFGKLVSTIELINGIMGGNGIGRLFSKGAKALESISDYFNAAKMNQAADIILKIVAAMGILYTLLALMTFLPEENMERMKEGLVQFGIALGAVVAGVFIISAAAAMAGANLLGLAAGFVGVALAIKLAFDSLSHMADLLEKIDKAKIDAAMAKLKEIMNEYSMIILKTIAPFALLSTRYSGSIAGIGAVFLGMAATIYILLSAIEKFGQGTMTLNPNFMDVLTEFVSKIFIFLAAATALLIFAARDSEVHGIGIAIATIGVAFAALKVVFPLIEDIVAEKDLIMDAQSAIATFSLFMLALSASMYLITSGVRGLISGLASILMLRLYLAILANQVIPFMSKVVNAIANLADLYQSRFSNGDFTTAFLWVGGTMAAILGLMALALMAIERSFGEVNPLAFLFIGGTIVGTIAIISNLLIPAFEQLAETADKLDPQKYLYSVLALGMMTLPLIALARMFKKVIQSMEEILDLRNSKSFINLNLGIFTRTFNAAASVFQSMMFTFIGIYGFMYGMLMACKNLDWEKVKMLGTIFAGAVVIILSVLIPLSSMWSNVTHELKILYTNIGKFDKNGKKIKDIQKAIQNMAGSVEAVIWAIAGLALVLTGLSIFASVEFESKMENIKSTLWTFVLALLAITAGFIFIILSVYAVFKTVLIDSKKYDSNLVSRASQFVKSMDILVGVIGTVFATITAVAVFAVSLLNEKEFTRFNTVIGYLLATFFGIVAGVTIFIAGFVAGILILSEKLKASGEVFSSTSSTIRALAILVGSVSLVFAALIGVASWVSTWNNPQRWYDFIETLAALTGIFLLIVAGLTVFVGVISWAFGSFSKEIKTFQKRLTDTTTMWTGIATYMTPTLNMIIAMLGLVLTIITLGSYLLPAIEKLKDVDFSKIVATFLLSIAFVITMLGSAIALMSFSKTDEVSKLNKVPMGELLSILKTAVIIMGPIVALAFLMKEVSNVLSTLTMGNTTNDQIEALMGFVAILGVFTLIATILGIIAGSFPAAAAGIAVVAVLILSIGITAKLLADAAEKIWAIYKEWTGIMGIVGAFSSGGTNLMDSMATSIEENGDKPIGAIKKVCEGMTAVPKKVFNTGSPSKVFKQYGKWVDQGLALGIKTNTRGVISASETLAEIPNSIFVDENQIASPSKVFYKNGRFIVAGLTEGMASGKSSIESTMDMISDTIGSSLEKGLGNINFNPNIDILGGKTLDQIADEFIGGLEPGSILGKIFGLDEGGLSAEEIQHWSYLKSIGAKIPPEIEKSLKEGTAKVDERSFGQKIYDKFVNSGFMDKLKSLGEVFGINVGEGATSDQVFGKVKEKLFGEGGLLTDIKNDIVDGDWVSVGEKIATGIGNGFKAIFGPVVDWAKKGLKGLGIDLGGSDEPFEDIITSTTSEGGYSFRIDETNADEWAKNMVPKINKETTKETAKTISGMILSDDYILNGVVYEASSKLGHTFDEIFSAANEDAENRLNPLMDILLDPSNYTSTIDKATGIITNKMTSSGEEAILALLKVWGIHSPSTVMRDIYEQVGAGAIEGFDEKAPFITNAMTDAANEEMREMSLAFQGIDQLASGMGSISPSIVPMIDTSEIGSFASMMSDINSGKISASLDFTSSAAMIAAGQMELAKSIDSLERNVLASLAKGEFVKVSVENTVNESNLFDSFIEYQRREYNRSGHSI